LSLKNSDRTLLIAIAKQASKYIPMSELAIAEQIHEIVMRSLGDCDRTVASYITAIKRDSISVGEDEVIK
jgi:hypothetical protein